MGFAINKLQSWYLLVTHPVKWHVHSWCCVQFYTLPTPWNKLLHKYLECRPSTGPVAAIRRFSVGATRGCTANHWQSVPHCWPTVSHISCPRCRHLLGGWIGMWKKRVSYWQLWRKKDRKKFGWNITASAVNCAGLNGIDFTAWFIWFHK